MNLLDVSEYHGKMLAVGVRRLNVRPATIGFLSSALTVRAHQLEISDGHQLSVEGIKEFVGVTRICFLQPRVLLVVLIYSSVYMSKAQFRSLVQ